jgi:acetoacetate decarboxylase
LTNPALPRGSYRFEEYLIITYRTDPQKLRELVLEPLQLREPLVRFEFIRMPNSSGFGDCTESGQVIPVSFKGRKGSYNHCMFLNDHPPIAGGRELWDFPKKLASPTLRTEIDTLFGTLNFGSIRVAPARWVRSNLGKSKADFKCSFSRIVLLATCRTRSDRRNPVRAHRVIVAQRRHRSYVSSRSVMPGNERTI